MFAVDAGWVCASVLVLQSQALLLFAGEVKLIVFLMLCVAI